MKIIERPKISGADWLLIQCDKCEQQFLVAPQEINANGSIKCEFCPNICRKEDIKDILAEENIDHFIDGVKAAWKPDDETDTKEEQK